MCHDSMPCLSCTLIKLQEQQLANTCKESTHSAVAFSKVVTYPMQRSPELLFSLWYAESQGDC